MEFVHDMPQEMEREEVNYNEESPTVGLSEHAMSLEINMDDDNNFDVMCSQHEEWPFVFMSGRLLLTCHAMSLGHF